MSIALMHRSKKTIHVSVGPKRVKSFAAALDINICAYTFLALMTLLGSQDWSLSLV